MRIAHLAPYSLTFPLKKHNGRYSWMLSLARAQVRAGHEVIIFTGPGSHDESRAIAWRSLDRPAGETSEANNLALISAAFADPTIDIFHSHFDSLPYRIAHKTSRPVVTTQHWFPTPKIGATMRAAYDRKNFVAVPVTKLMAKTDDSFGIRRSQVVYHGIDLEKFTPNYNEKSDRLLFVGRITPSKGVKEAIELARQAGAGLDIIGKLNDKDQAYWNDIAPLIDDETIRYLGPKPPEEVASAMRNARAMLFPSLTPEAFGLVTVEAQACGTPVIISDVGASRELVEDGKTGFVCSSNEQYLAAIKNVDKIDPADCRNNAERFDIKVMLRRYQSLYQELTK